MKRIIFPLSAVIFLIASAYGEFQLYRVDRSVSVEIASDDQELLKIIPNQPYAYIGNDGKMRIEIGVDNPNYPGKGDGISPDSIYAFDCIFYVENSLWENQTVFFTVNSTSPYVLVYSSADLNHSSPENAAKSIRFPIKWLEKECVGMVFKIGNETQVGVSINATI